MQRLTLIARMDVLMMERVAGVMDGILIIRIMRNIRKCSSNYLTIFLYGHILCPYFSFIKPFQQMKKFIVLFMLSVMCFTGCLGDKSKAEKIQKKRDKIVNVKNEIVDIKTEVLFGKSLLYIIDDYLVLLEVASKTPKCIHLFDKNTFRHIASTGLLGRGPGEITEPGNIGLPHVRTRVCPQAVRGLDPHRAGQVQDLGLRGDVLRGMPRSCGGKAR